MNATGVVALVSLSSCSSLGSSLLPSGLADALGNVTGLSSAIGDFKSSLGSSLGSGLDAAGLGQLKDFASQAGDLGQVVGGFKDKVSEAAADPLAAISNQLGEMGGFDVDALKNLPGADQLKAVTGFADSASDVGRATNDFLAQFGG